MRKPWPRVSLNELLRLERRPVKVEPEKVYQEIGIYCFGRGIFHKTPRTGFEVGDKDLFLMKEGDFILQVTFAWEGAVAIVSAAENEMYGSTRYPTFRVDESRCVPQFLLNYFKTEEGLQQLVGICPGSAGRNRVLSIKRLPEVLVPLPQLAEQRRVVAQIEELAAQVYEARTLRHQAAAEAEALMASAFSYVCSGKLASTGFAGESAGQLLHRISRVKWPGQVQARKRKAMTLPPPPEVPKSWLVVDAGELQERGAILDIQDGNHGGDYPRKVEFGDEGVPFVTAKQFDGGTVRIGEAPRLPHERASRLRIGFAKPNDVLLTHNASVGDVAVAPKDSGDFLLGTSATYWRCNPEALEPRYLFYFMRSGHFQGQLKFIMKQTTRNQVSVLKQVNLWICFPPLSEQRRIVAELDALEAEMEEMKGLQTETAGELDALLPSILDRAFKGEL